MFLTVSNSLSDRATKDTEPKTAAMAVTVPMNLIFRLLLRTINNLLNDNPNIDIM
jgi:hypothetical protein